MPKERHLTKRIRSILLYPEPRVAIATAADLLGWTDREMRANIRAGIIEKCGDSMIDVRELAEMALQTWPLTVIEDALGVDASLLLPAALRTRNVSFRLPLYVIQAMEYLARENRESAEAFVTRELHGLAYEQKDRLSAAIPGFAEAVDWPFESQRTQA